MPDALPLLPTTVVGSYALPSWVYAADDWMQRGLYGPIDTEETFNDAVDRAIQDQEKAGIDIISDGEMRRRGFVQGFVTRFPGSRMSARRARSAKPASTRSRSTRPLARSRWRTASASSRSSNISATTPRSRPRSRCPAPSPSPPGTSRSSITRTAPSWPPPSCRRSRTRSGGSPRLAPNTSRSMSRPFRAMAPTITRRKDLVAQRSTNASQA